MKYVFKGFSKSNAVFTFLIFLTLFLFLTLFTNVLIPLPFALLHQALTPPLLRPPPHCYVCLCVMRICSLANPFTFNGLKRKSMDATPISFMLA